MTVYAALSKTPHALADGLMLVFQHPVNPNVCCTILSARTLSRTLCHSISKLTKALNIY